MVLTPPNVDEEVSLHMQCRRSLSTNDCAQVGSEALKIYLEEEDSLDDHVDTLLAESLEDFPEDDICDSAARHAAEITRACITESTRVGHIR